PSIDDSGYTSPHLPDARAITPERGSNLAALIIVVHPGVIITLTSYEELKGERRAEQGGKQTRTAEIDGVIPTSTDVLFFSKIKRRSFNLDEVTSRDGNTIDSNDFRGINLQMMPKNIVNTILEGVQVPSK
ncbi:hypothetical protein C0993_007429, partial [Termitomyces sp. T159_Od127]